jgi:hypothetical protein
MLICVVAAALAGVTVGGEKLAVAPVGSPLAENFTGLLNAPLCGVTVMV